MVKEQLLQLLSEQMDAYISGAELARRLSVSRTAIWKGISQLREEGYLIDSATNRGYCLRSESDVLSREGIERHLRTEGMQLQVFPSVGSTNTLLKSLAAEGAPEGTAVIAAAQTEGRGRMGRSFYSPPGSGIYLSLLLRPEISAESATALTCCAAVCVAEAIEELSGGEAQIKWVNDVFVRGKKVCGILTEASVDCENGKVSYVVVGIGINLLPPAGGFPEELEHIAGAAFARADIPELRCRLAASVLDRLMGYYSRFEARSFYEPYRRRSLVLGQRIGIPAAAPGKQEATALDIDPSFALLVRYDDGSTGLLQSGEVSISLGKK